MREMVHYLSQNLFWIMNRKMPNLNNFTQPMQSSSARFLICLKHILNLIGMKLYSETLLFVSNTNCTLW